MFITTHLVITTAPRKAKKAIASLKPQCNATSIATPVFELCGVFNFLLQNVLVPRIELSRQAVRERLVSHIKAILKDNVKTKINVVCCVGRVEIQIEI